MESDSTLPGCLETRTIPVLGRGCPDNQADPVQTELLTPESNMGWLKHILLGDLGQSLDIQETAAEVEAQRAAMDRQMDRLERRQQDLAAVQARTERLHLALTALSRYLISKGVIDPAELEAYLQQVDGEDGVKDGKLAFDGSRPRPRLPVHDPEWDRPGL